MLRGSAWPNAPPTCMTRDRVICSALTGVPAFDGPVVAVVMIWRRPTAPDPTTVLGISMKSVAPSSHTAILVPSWASPRSRQG